MIILPASAGGIDPSEANSTAADVYPGKTFFAAGSDEKQTGAMPKKTPDKTAITTTARTYEAGLYDEFTVSAPTQRSGTSETLSSGASRTYNEGYYQTAFTVKGWTPTKTQGETTYQPKLTDQTIAAGTYCSGAQTIKALSTINMNPENIVNGKTISINTTDKDGNNVTIKSTTGSAKVINVVNKSMEKKTENNSGSGLKKITLTNLNSDSTYIVTANIFIWAGEASTGSWYISAGADDRQNMDNQPISSTGDSSKQSFMSTWIVKNQTSLDVGATIMSNYSYTLNVSIVRIAL